MDPLIENKQERHRLMKKNRNIVDKAGKEDRGLKEAEEKEFNKREKKIDKLEDEIRAMEEEEEREKEIVNKGLEDKNMNEEGLLLTRNQKIADHLPETLQSGKNVRAGKFYAGLIT